MIMKNSLLFMLLLLCCCYFLTFFWPARCVVVQSQRRQKDLCYYSFNILRARDQLMAVELFFLFSFRLWCVIYEIERIECRMRIAYNETLKYPPDKLS